MDQTNHLLYQLSTKVNLFSKWLNWMGSRSHSKFEWGVRPCAICHRKWRTKFLRGRRRWRGWRSYTKINRDSHGWRRMRITTRLKRPVKNQAVHLSCYFVNHGTDENVSETPSERMRQNTINEKQFHDYCYSDKAYVSELWIEASTVEVAARSAAVCDALLSTVPEKWNKGYTC